MAIDNTQKKQDALLNLIRCVDDFRAQWVRIESLEDYMTSNGFSFDEGDFDADGLKHMDVDKLGSLLVALQALSQYSEKEGYTALIRQCATT